MKLEAALDKITGSRPTGNGGYRLPCPSCGRERTLTFSPNRGFRCWGCGESGKDERMFARFLSKNGIPVDEEGPAVPAGKLHEMLMTGHVLNGKAVTKEAPAESVPFPRASYPIDESRWPRFLSTRRVPVDLVKEREWLACVAGPYSGHVIIPVHTLDYHAWVAYQTHREAEFEHFKFPKTLDAPGYPKGEMLYLYDLIYEEAPPVVVLVEGIMDAMRALQYKREEYLLPFPMALLGSGLTEAQGKALDYLARHRGLQRIILALDADAWPQKVGIVSKCLRKWVGGIDLRVADLKPFGGKDPDQMRLSEWRNALSMASDSRFLL